MALFASAVYTIVRFEGKESTKPGFIASEHCCCATGECWAEKNQAQVQLHALVHSTVKLRAQSIMLAARP